MHMTDDDTQYGEHGRCEATASSTGERCKQPATGDHGKCRYHGGGSKKGADHPNFKHGKTSKYFRQKLSGRQEEVYDEIVEALDDPEDAKMVLQHVVARLILLGDHAQDSTMVREARQILSEFNIVPNSDSLEVDAKVESEQTLELDDGTKDVVREVLQRRRKDTNDE